MYMLSPLDTQTVLHFCLYRAEKTEVLSEDLLQVSCGISVCLTMMEISGSGFLSCEP